MFYITTDGAFMFWIRFIFCYFKILPFPVLQLWPHLKFAEYTLSRFTTRIINEIRGRLYFQFCVYYLTILTLWKRTWVQQLRLILYLFFLMIFLLFVISFHNLIFQKICHDYFLSSIYHKVVERVTEDAVLFNNGYLNVQLPTTYLNYYYINLIITSLII